MIRILVVDGDEAIRMLLAEELGEEGYDVVTAGSRAPLQDLVEKNKPDLMVMDIGVVEQNTPESLQAILNAPWNLPVVICTPFPAYRYDLASVDARSYVVKSSDLSKLKRRIRTFLEGNPHPVSVQTDGQLPSQEPICMEQMKLQWREGI